MLVIQKGGGGLTRLRLISGIAKKLPQGGQVNQECQTVGQRDSRGREEEKVRGDNYSRTTVVQMSSESQGLSTDHSEAWASKRLQAGIDRDPVGIIVCCHTILP